jgi:NAD(P)-dependent dehydrogenase (short-subunit alcohol dehydrogenase family)
MTDKKTILVTGASSGIGAAIAARLRHEGHHVVGTSRKGGGDLLALDVDSDESVARGVRELLGRTGRIDVLVNNAGYLQAGALEEVTLDQARAQFETNYFGVVRMIRAVLPYMRIRGSGTIVTVSSLAGLVPLPFWGHYSASKFAVEGMMESLRHEVRPLGIKVAMIEPGAIRTPFYAQAEPAALAAYRPWRERFFATMRKFESDAPPPEVVAEVAARLVRSKSPALRNKVTREATLFPLLRWLLPASLFEEGVRGGFALDKASSPPRALEAAGRG